MLEMAGILLALAVGVRLSYFFSGSETGFYRLSLPRLGIDARAGDTVAQRLLWFVERPSAFVATCLVGNNLANYLTSAAVSSLVVALLGYTTDLGEICATLLFSPFLFLLGEVVPKTLYYQIPYAQLRHGSHWFRLAYWVFLPCTWPLVQVTRVIEHWAGQNDQPVEAILGRNRFFQLVEHGHREGVLTDLQSRLASALLQLAPRPIQNSILPLQRVIGVEEHASREEVLRIAKAFGLSIVPVRHQQPDSWFGYLVVREVKAHPGRPVVHALPRLQSTASKLEALHLLFHKQVPVAAVYQDRQLLGLLKRQALVEQLFRPDLVLNPLRNTGLTS